jgi:hypothetical protein
MEHRCCPRIKASLSVSRWHGREWWGTYNTENIRSVSADQSDGQARDHQAAAQPAGKVCVECLGTRHCKSAFVVHRAGQGLGLMLAPPEPEYTTTFLRLLNRQLQSPTQNVVRHG